MKTTVYGVICALLLAALLHAVPAVGQTDAAQSTSIASHKGGNVYQPVTQHHELRIGWGDMMFETLVWHEKTLLPNANSNIIPKNYRYTQNNKPENCCIICLNRIRYFFYKRLFIFLFHFFNQ